MPRVELPDGTTFDLEPVEKLTPNEETLLRAQGDQPRDFIGLEGTSVSLQFVPAENGRMLAVVAAEFPAGYFKVFDRPIVGPDGTIPGLKGDAMFGGPPRLRMVARRDALTSDGLAKLETRERDGVSVGDLMRNFGVKAGEADA